MAEQFSCKIKLKNSSDINVTEQRTVNAFLMHQAVTLNQFSDVKRKIGSNICSVAVNPYVNKDKIVTFNF
ncbi:hypothetical protein O3M35_007449 [Rhynocoris fuscipes]|uniref:Uncharacterized protein n=1 Tax=Rhynocoris fuscipes TaxID=488301 RepID=A0AAW1D9G5_9HEMI